jgi:hypothetical protein
LTTGALALQAPSLTPSDPGGSNIGSAKSLTADAYVAGSFTRTFRAEFSVSEGNSTTIRSVVFRRGNFAGATSLRLLLDANQTKTSSQTLLIVWRKSWGRVLVN